MRLAAIDCGTNTTILLVVEVKIGTEPMLYKVEEQLEYTKLGQGLEETGFLNQDAIQRSLHAIEKFHRLALDLDAKHVVAFATEAVRAAKNGHSFLDQATALGIPIRLLKGTEEAEYAWLGVQQSLLIQKSWGSVLDIGGGSTQLTVGHDHQIVSFASVPLGIVRLGERHLHHDPPTQEELQNLCQDIDQKLQGLPAPQGQLIGISGSLTALASLQLELPTFDSSKIHGFSLTQKQVLSWRDRLAQLSLPRRKMLAGMDPKRADLVYIGAAIVAQIMLHADLPTLTLCSRGGRWGILQEWAHKNLIQKKTL